MIELSGLFFSAIMSSTILPGHQNLCNKFNQLSDHNKYLILTIAALGN